MKVINFFGAPGVGKTRSTMLLTAHMKEAGVDVEASLEVVKEYIHTKNYNLLNYQHYIFAQQDRQLQILQDSNEVEFAITDAPLLHSIQYGQEMYPFSYQELVFDFFNAYDNINYFITRNHAYSHQGRVHDEAQSDAISRKLKSFLINSGVPFKEIKSTDDLKEVVMKDLLENHRVKGYYERKYHHDNRLK